MDAVIDPTEAVRQTTRRMAELGVIDADPDAISVEWDTAHPAVGEIDGKHGVALIDHVFFYGMDRDELELLSAEQWATLEAAGLARSD